MRTMRSFMFCVLCLTLLFGCNNNNDANSPMISAATAVALATAPRPFDTYRDLPNITASEIDAVASFKKQNRTFTLAVIEGSEAFANINGEYRGFAARLCEFLSGFFEIPFELKLMEWDDIISGLANGSVDFTSDLTPTPERRQTYFMTDPITMRSVKIFRVAESEPLQNISETRTLRYGFLAKTVTESDVRNVSEFPFEAVDMHTYGEALQSLRERSIDAFFDENTSELFFLDHSDITSGYFFPLILSEISLAAQNDTLAPIISVVQKFIENGGVEYLNTLRKTGDRDFRKNRFLRSLSAEETAYLRDMANVRFLAEYDNYPTSFFNSRENEWQGIAFDILREIEALTGFGFTVANEHGTPGYALANMLAQGDGQMISELAHGSEKSEHFLSSENPHTSDYLALLSRSDMRNITISDVFDLRVGAVRGHFGYTMFKRWFPSHANFTEYEDAVTLYHDLDKGKIDLAMSTRNQLFYLTNYLELPGFKVNYQFDHEYNSSYGFGKNEEMLRGIIDKALREIDSESIALRWYHKTYDYRIKQAQERMALFLWIGILLFSTLLFITVTLLTRRTGKRLERAVTERTAELYQTNKMLERASRVKSEFLARTSHEIRTPMNVIIGLTQISLREKIQPEIVRENIITIKQAGENLISIINDLLDISKIESGRVDLICADYDFSVFIKSIIGIIDLRVVGTNVHFSVDIDPGIPNILHGDELKIRRVFLNILSNAVKYTPRGTITLTIEGEREDDESDTITLYITVSDTGVGIKEEDIKKLFVDFVRLDDAINSGIEGTGLGLAISRQLLTAMGGEINVTSIYGKGTTFTITLPQKIGSAKTFVPPRMSHDFGAAPFIAPLAKVLIVDDVKANLEVAAGLMSIYEMQIETCLSGAEAIERAKKTNYDLILMDIMMPQMNGEETLLNIRALSRENPHYEKVPVIALTAVALPDTCARLVRNGFCEVLVKPIDMEKLNAALEKYISENKRIDAKLLSDDRRSAGDRRNFIRSRESDRTDRRGASGTDEFVGVSIDDVRIDGINVSLGVYNTGGKIEWYLRSLEIFCGSVLDKAKFMKSALAMKDLRLYKTSADELKDIAANVGAVNLSESVKRLAEAVTNGDMAYLRDHTELFLTDVISLHQRIQSALVAIKRRVKH